MVPESATMLFKAGFQFTGTENAEKDAKKFQIAVLQNQTHLETMFRSIAEQDDKPSIVLIDRGLLDGKAFIPPGLWTTILREQGLDEQKLRDDSYDAIIHLVTAADGAVEHYDMENEARADNP